MGRVGYNLITEKEKIIHLDQRPSLSILCIIYYTGYFLWGQYDPGGGPKFSNSTDPFWGWYLGRVTYDALGESLCKAILGTLSHFRCPYCGTNFYFPTPSVVPLPPRSAGRCEAVRGASGDPGPLSCYNLNSRNGF